MLISPKYEVLAEIGRGGMGIVYKVRHTALDTVYALKILPSHLADDEALVARFHREARVMAQLHHPNIVRVIDVDKAGDLHYFVMEYVDGRSLSKIIATEGASGLGGVVDVAIQVGRGLAYAHGRRPAVIHRDIKPANILMESESGRAVVTDFGLAKLAGGSDSIRTESGQFIGTLRYCAPEQMQGSREVDARVDVYALGMVIYEMYAGRSAYVDFERPQMVAGLLQNAVEHPFTFTPDTPEAFQALVRRATAKDRARRYSTVADLLLDLERLRGAVGEGDDQGVTVSFETPWRSPRRRLVAVSTVLVLGVSLGAGIVAREPLRQLVGGGAARDAATEPVADERDAVAEKPAAGIRRFVSVMDFTSGSPDPQLAWMRDAIRDNLNSRLSLSPECKVFSKEFIDFKAQQMVRQGHYQDVKAAAMEVAQNLGVTKAVIPPRCARTRVGAAKGPSCGRAVSRPGSWMIWPAFERRMRSTAMASSRPRKARFERCSRNTAGRASARTWRSWPRPTTS
jgi:tRNA A-37 threonylcarbamoyl transferase component Bud32